VWVDGGRDESWGEWWVEEDLPPRRGIATKVWSRLGL
jgi:hypothetical protein